MKRHTCIYCGGDLPKHLYLYCSSACSLASRRLKWTQLRPGEPFPEALSASS
jgi:hypothetical protein